MSNWWRVAIGALKTTAEAPSCRSYHTIQAVPRELSGHWVAARERAQGRIPAVIFSKTYVQRNPNDPTSVVATDSVSQRFLITTDRKQIKSIIKNVKLPHFCSTKFPLQIRAGPCSETILQYGKVLPIKVHRDEEGKILNLVFMWANDGAELMVDVPIVYKGEDVCPGLKKGGSLLKRTTLKYLCPAEHIPSQIEVDISNLDIDDKVSMDEVNVHPSLRLLSKDDRFPICRITSTKVEDSENSEKIDLDAVSDNVENSENAEKTNPETVS